MLVLSFFETLDLSQVRAEYHPLNLLSLTLIPTTCSHWFDLLSQNSTFQSESISHLLSQGLSGLIKILITLEHIHGTNGSRYSWMCGSSTWGHTSLSRIIEHKNLIAWYVLYLFDFDILFELDNALGIIRVNLLHLLEFLLPLVLGFHITQVIEDIP